LERVVAMQCGSQRRRRCLCAAGVWHPEKRRSDRVSVLRGGVCVLREEETHMRWRTCVVWRLRLERGKKPSFIASGGVCT
jgi:hypothetical protein